MFTWSVFLFTIALSSCSGVPLEKVLEVPEGHTVQISCESKDGHHAFAFWELASRNILGPGNEYNDSKYDYNVLNGALYVRNTSPEDEGVYTCFSKDLQQLNRLNARSVRMVVMPDWSRHDHDDNTVSVMGVILFVGCLFILLGGGFLFYTKWKKEHRLKSLLIDDEEDDSGEELFIAPGTSKSSGNIILESTKSMDESLSTDFGSILSAANK